MVNKEDNGDSSKASKDKANKVKETGEDRISKDKEVGANKDNKDSKGLGRGKTRAGKEVRDNKDNKELGVSNGSKVVLAKKAHLKIKVNKVVKAVKVGALY